MDRTYWCEFGHFQPGEKEVTQQRGVRLYDGDERVCLTNCDKGSICNTEFSCTHKGHATEAKRALVHVPLNLTRGRTDSALTFFILATRFSIE